MSESERNTLEAIHCAAKEEFTEKGFKSASLRNIVKTAGVTTGAFYGYYNSKAELFKALVGETYDYIMNRYNQAHEMFQQLPEEVQPEQMGKFSRECMDELLVYCYDHTPEVQLILKCSEGTKYAFMIDEMAELETESTHKYYETLGRARFGHGNYCCKKCYSFAACQDNDLRRGRKLRTYSLRRGLCGSGF